MTNKKTNSICILGWEIEALINYLKENNETIEGLHLYADQKLGDIVKVSMQTKVESDKKGYILKKQYEKHLENHASPFTELLKDECVKSFNYWKID